MPSEPSLSLWESEEFVVDDGEVAGSAISKWVENYRVVVKVESEGAAYKPVVSIFRGGLCHGKVTIRSQPDPEDAIEEGKQSAKTIINNAEYYC